MSKWFIQKSTGVVWEVSDEVLISRLMSDSGFEPTEPRETNPVMSSPEHIGGVSVDEIVQALMSSGALSNISGSVSLKMGTVSTLDAGEKASASASKQGNTTVITLGIPKGEPGKDGKTPTLEMGALTTLEPGSRMTGTLVKKDDGSEAYIINLAVPKGERGEKGDAAEISGIAERLETIEERLEGQSDGGAVSTEPTKWAVLVVAGQSNAVGYDESAPNPIFDVQRDTNRVKQLGYWTRNKEIIDLGFCAENFQDMRPNGYKSGGTKGMHLPLANMLLDYIPADYGVLVLPCAFGGTAFGNGGSYDSESMKVPDNQNQCFWGANANQYQAMRDRLKYVLDMNSENVLLGVVWVQGEHGASNPDNNNNSFDAMTQQFFRDFANYRTRTRRGVMDKSIWFNVETTEYWYSSAFGNSAGAKKIWDHYREWNPDTYVEVSRDTNLTNAVRNVPDGTAWTGTQTSATRNSHFGNNAYATVIAPRVLRAMLNNGCLFYSGMYDKDTITAEVDTSALEKKIDALTAQVEAFRSALKSADIEIPSSLTWRAITPEDWTYSWGNQSAPVKEDNWLECKNVTSGWLLPAEAKGVRLKMTSTNGKNAGSYLGYLVATANGANNVRGFDIDFTSDATVTHWIKCHAGYNQYDGDNGASANEHYSLFRVHDVLITAEYKDDGRLHISNENGASHIYTPISTDGQEPRFGLGGLQGFSDGLKFYDIEILI